MNNLSSLGASNNRGRWDRPNDRSKLGENNTYNRDDYMSQFNKPKNNTNTKIDAIKVGYNLSRLDGDNT